MKLFPMSLILLFILFFQACHSTDQGNIHAQKPIVLASIQPQVGFLEILGAGLIDIEALIPAGASYYTYEPSIKQLKRAEKAKLFLMVGHPAFPFEKRWLATLQGKNNNLKIIDSFAGFASLQEDSHLWTSPSAMRIMLANFSLALQELVPDSQQLIRTREKELLVRIDEIDAEIQVKLSQIKQRQFLVFHPAWGYFAREYQLEQIAIEHSHSSESDADHLREIIDLAREKSIDTILIQPQLSRQSAEIIANEVSARLVVVDPLDKDWFRTMRMLSLALASKAES